MDNPAKPGFHGCYLLTSLKPGCRNHIYIGYTVDPPRRLRQHNGEIANGANKTKRKQPWQMVLVVFGFSDEKSALRFEWAWQHPRKSRLLKEHSIVKGLKVKDECLLPGKIKVLSAMLNTPPWCRLPLSIHWISPVHAPLFPSRPPLQRHMKERQGPWCWREGNDIDKHETSATLQPSDSCMVCLEDMDDRSLWLPCVKPKCSMRAHMVCLAGWFLAQDGDQCLPVTGSCPQCRTEMLWGEVIRSVHTRERIESQSKCSSQSLQTTNFKEEQRTTLTTSSSTATTSTVPTIETESLTPAYNQRKKLTRGRVGDITDSIRRLSIQNTPEDDAEVSQTQKKTSPLIVISDTESDEEEDNVCCTECAKILASSINESE